MDCKWGVASFEVGPVVVCRIWDLAMGRAAGTVVSESVRVGSGLGGCRLVEGTVFGLV